MPSDLLKPFRANADGPWTRVQAAHLLRRAGFRPTVEQIDTAVAEGHAKTIDSLFANAPESERCRDLDTIGDSLTNGEDIAPLAGWWLARMIHTARPLAARMTLFWHNHFATSNDKVRSPAMMLAQLRTLEQHALGPFDALLIAVARDPAMIVWLDGESNNKGRPNENFARELMELFTLGPGHYTERDIKEIGRAFTGWHQRRGQFHFSRIEHDDGHKTFLGQSGDFDGADVIPILLRLPAASAFLSRKLLHEFLSDDPDTALVDAFSDVIRARNFHLGNALRVLFTSQAMLAPAHYRARISSPLEFVVGTARALNLRLDMPAAARAAGEMGQRLFEPPSVKGWPGGHTWIDSATMLVRMNAAAAACRTRDDGVGFDPAALRKRYKLNSSDAMVAFLIDLLLDGRAPTDLRARLRDAASSIQSFDESIRTTARLILGSPEYQLV